MEDKCFVNGCPDQVSKTWTLNSVKTHSCENHSISDSTNKLKSQIYSPSKPSNFLKPVPLFLAIFLFYLVLSTANFILSQNKTLSNIVEEIEVLKSKSALNNKFFSELSTVKTLLEHSDLSFQKFQNPETLFNQPAGSQSQSEVISALSAAQKLQKKIDILKKLGFIYSSKDSEVLSINEILVNDIIYGLMDGSIVRISLTSQIPEFLHLAKYRIYGIVVPKDESFLYITGDSQINLWNHNMKSFVKSVPAHMHWVLSATISADDNYLITASCDKLIKIWDRYTLVELAVFHGHLSDVWSVSISTDNNYLISGGEDKMVILWDVKTRSVLAELAGHVGPIYSVKFTEDSKYAVSAGGDGCVKLWNLETYLEVFSFEHKGLVRSVLLVEDEVLLSIAGKTLRVWDFPERSLMTQLNHTDELISLAVTSDLKFIITGDTKSRIWVWNFDDFTLYWVFGGSKENIKKIELSEQQTMLALGEPGLIRVWDLDTRLQIAVITKIENYVPWIEIFGKELREVFR